jgi:crotonobetainyl-CoA:carnitine CoA-transferase CaiB-like acyl-CoA transferase
MLDAAIAFIWPDCGSDAILLGEEIEHRPPTGAAGRLIEFADGWATTIALTNDEIMGMFKASNMPEVADDPRFNSAEGRREHREAWREQLARLRELQKTMQLADAERSFAEAGAPFGRVLAIDDLPADPQIQANGLFIEREHPVAGVMRETRPAARFSGTPTTAGKAAPTVGEDTREILEEIGLGDRFADLLKRGIVAVSSES